MTSLSGRKYRRIELLSAVFCICALGMLHAQPTNGSEDAAVVGPEDTLTIQVLDAEELSKDWRVSSTGELNLPMLGRLHVGGLTVEELEAELAQRLKRYYKQPQVTVFVSQVRSRPITITGAVERPGLQQLQGTSTLLEAIMLAGGPKSTAADVRITREESQGSLPLPGSRLQENGLYSVAEVDLKTVMDARTSAANLKLKPNDVVAVFEPQQQKLIHIVGEVNKPGAVELVHEQSVSLLKVLAVAGGLTRTASKKNAIIRHIEANGLQSSSALIDLKQIMSGKAQDLLLSAGDIVIVAPSQLSSYMQIASQSAITTGMYVLARF